MTQQTSLILERHAPLRAVYAEHPERAISTKWAGTELSAETDTLHSKVRIGQGYGVSQRTGIDRSVGGDHDLPNPGDMLCAALATCEDGTIRMIADLLGIPILDLRVEVTGEVDVRGCLGIAPSVKVGFTSMKCRVHLRVPSDIDAKRVATLKKHAERLCVNLDTLRSGVAVDMGLSVETGT